MLNVGETQGVFGRLVGDEVGDPVKVQAMEGLDLS